MIRQAAALLKRYPAFYDFARHGVYGRIRSALRGRIFRAYYERNLWNSDESASGPGSTLAATEGLRRDLPRLLTDLGIKSILDLPCGDLAWMQHVDLTGVRYTGGDLVPAIVEANRAAFGARGEFLILDLLKDPLFKVDAVFCRDCLNHLSNAEVKAALRNIRRCGAKYLIVTQYPQCERNADTVTPYWRHINFKLPPFNFGAPLRMLPDCEDKALGVWRLDDILA